MKGITKVLSGLAGVLLSAVFTTAVYGQDAMASVMAAAEPESVTSATRTVSLILLVVLIAGVAIISVSILFNPKKEDLDEW